MSPLLTSPQFDSDVKRLGSGHDGVETNVPGSKAPLFIAGAINAWSWTPSDVAELAGLLADPFELIRGDTFFELLHRTL